MAEYEIDAAPLLDEAAALLKTGQRVVAVTGAGISAESGIPTFRDALTGLWARFDAEQLATPAAFRHDKALVWGWYEWRRMRVLQCQPNRGHRALARLAEIVPEFTLITQNVDDLHERAGSSSVVHLHGSLHTPRCTVCSKPHRLPPDIPNEPEGGRRIEPPACLHCGHDIRPGVVWFGEGLPEQAWQHAESAVRRCDLLLTIGTSGLVYPAAGLPVLARRLGKPVIVINPDETEHDRLATLILRGKAGEVLPRLLTRFDAP